MNERFFEIFTQEASELKEYEWIDIAKFMKQFPSRIKRSSGPEYYKSKLLNSPFGMSYVTRALDRNRKCIGLTTLTKKCLELIILIIHHLNWAILMFPKNFKELEFILKY